MNAIIRALFVARRSSAVRLTNSSWRIDSAKRERDEDTAQLRPFPGERAAELERILGPSASEPTADGDGDDSEQLSGERQINRCNENARAGCDEHQRNDG